MLRLHEIQLYLQICLSPVDTIIIKNYLAISSSSYASSLVEVFSQAEGQSTPVECNLRTWRPRVSTYPALSPISVELNEVILLRWYRGQHCHRHPSQCQCSYTSKFFPSYLYVGYIMQGQVIEIRVICSTCAIILDGSILRLFGIVWIPILKLATL